MLKEMSVEEFIEKLSSSAPAPGGGGVAALSASLSAALESMVYSLTVNKKSFQKLTDEEKNKILSSYERTKKFSKDCLDYMEQDKENFEKVIDAMKMPKETDEDKGKRKLQIEKATEQAAVVPFNTIKSAFAFYDDIDIALKYGNINLMADVAVAAIMIDAAIESSFVNVKVNMDSIHDKEKANLILQQCEHCLKESKIRKKKILSEISFLK